MLRPTLEAAEELASRDKIAVEVIDLLSLAPLDHELLVNSVKKTGRAVVVHEAPRSFGPGAEIVAKLMEGAFYYLETPIARVTGFDLIIPYFSREKHYLPGVARIVAAARKTFEG
jgi:pyruvate dehydrogenase E1 component beta subunit